MESTGSVNFNENQKWQKDGGNRPASEEPSGCLEATIGSLKDVTASNIEITTSANIVRASANDVTVATNNITSSNDVTDSTNGVTASTNDVTASTNDVTASTNDDTASADDRTPTSDVTGSKNASNESTEALAPSSSPQEEEIHSLEVALAVLKSEKMKRISLEVEVKELKTKIECFEFVVRGLLQAREEEETRSAEMAEAFHELFKRTNSIESYEVADSVSEACDYEGRQAADRLQQERKKSRKWRRTGNVTLSKDFRDCL